ncbi:lipopolysaccharide export system ATP-binding protein [Thermodesulfobium acidiphilum]|uniref:Lipopolysaccharide export system ATP-binding protein n=1 Tax=Thermodesulfobium acidiphilum TaxID=1794699 RepID=A0A2R4W2F1_THEAF|nr:LPS export ABC transporter ATP-binding protein [Thermodesulfobium acidiphilum]AWB10945.1 lipopolysaccharide export system ATP-binding protein [Thermodesulfobium acidiphilum]
MIRAENLVKKYNKLFAVNDVSIKIGEGEVVGLLGPNGAGKTTTFYMIVGLTKPTSGSIYKDDLNITRFPIHKRANLGIAYLPQESSLFRKLNVYENLLLILSVSGKKVDKRKIRGILDEFRISDLARKRCELLSGGEARKVEIARSMILDPDFLLLDEPFSGIDPKSVSEMRDMIINLKEKGIGVLLTDHNVRDALKIIDRAYIISKGSIMFSGSPREITEHIEVRKEFLGNDFSL